LTWEDLPYAVLTEVSHYSERLNKVVGNDTDTVDYWGNCDYSVYMPEYSAVLLDGDSYAENTIAFNEGVWAESDGICPEFEYTITLTQDGVEYGSW
jgi:hypothetical protein